MEIYCHFYDKLVQVLPVEDATFIAKLCSKNLLPGDTKAKIHSLCTRSEKASYFLDHNIGPKVGIGSIDSLYKLLDVMENFEDDYMKELARDIKIKLSERNPIIAGEQDFRTIN